MNPNTPSDTSINYSPLHEPVTEADVVAYKQFVGVSGFGNKWLFHAIFLVFSFPIFLPLSYFLGTLGVNFGLQASLWLALVAAGFIAISVGISNYNKSRARLHKFAQRNDLSFIQRRSDPAYAGMVFDEGHSREIDAAYVFPGRAEVGNYTYVTGSGKSKTTHYWVYVKVKLPRKLPHMVLDAKKNNLFGRFSNLTDTFNKEQTLALEGDFNNYFTLYAPKQYERDALYVFTPDVMARLIDNGSAYDMEVIDDELYIYRSGRIKLDSETELKSLLAIVDAIGTDLREQTDYYADERVGDRTQNIIAAPGARLKHGVNWVVVGFVILMILFYTFDLWGQLLFWR